MARMDLTTSPRQQILVSESLRHAPVEQLLELYLLFAPIESGSNHSEAQHWMYRLLLERLMPTSLGTQSLSRFFESGRADEEIGPEVFMGLLQPEALERLFDRRRGKGVDDLEIRLGTTPLTLQYANSGGTKEVHHAMVGGSRIALGICRQPTSELWANVLREPANTQLIRNLGLRTNEVSAVIPVTVEGVPFPALVMTSYSDRGYRVFDSKNPDPDRHLGLIAPSMTVEDLSVLFDRVADEVALLAMNQIDFGHHPGDSINISTDGNGMRLFINDLPHRYLLHPGHPISTLAHKYTRLSVKAFMRAASHDELEACCLSDSISHNGPNQRSLTDQIYEEMVLPRLGPSAALC